MRTETNKNILAVAHQIGGANAIAPVVIDLVNSYNYNIEVNGYDMSAKGFAKANVDYYNPIEYTEKNETILYDLALETIYKYKPDLLLCGTSDGFNFEKALLIKCKELNIPTVAVLDNWTNLNLRFSEKEDDLKFLPDKLAVMDDYTKGELEKLGVSNDVIEVTGQPYLDQLLEIKQSGDKNRIRKNYNVDSKDILITFVSEPHSVDYGINDSFPLYKGFTEIDVLKCIIETINTLTGTNRFCVVLKIKTHPKEDGLFLLPLLKEANFDYEILDDVNQRELVYASDIVVGMESILLIESVLLGTPTISLQPNIKEVDNLYCNKAGLTIPVYSCSEFYKTVNSMIDNPSVFNSNVIIYEARKNVIKIIEKLLL
jgi:hypothetical protein